MVIATPTTTTTVTTTTTAPPICPSCIYSCKTYRIVNWKFMAKSPNPGHNGLALIYNYFGKDIFKLENF